MEPDIKKKSTPPFSQNLILQCTYLSYRIIAVRNMAKKRKISRKGTCHHSFICKVLYYCNTSEWLFWYISVWNKARHICFPNSLLFPILSYFWPTTQVNFTRRILFWLQLEEKIDVEHSVCLQESLTVYFINMPLKLLKCLMDSCVSLQRSIWQGPVYGKS